MRTSLLCSCLGVCLALSLSPSFLLAKSGKTSDPFIERSFRELQQITDRHSKAWGLGSNKGRYNMSLRYGTITFSFPDGKTVFAKIQIIGTHAPSGSFYWGWNHPSVRRPLSHAAALVRMYGKKNGITLLTQQPTRLTELQAWKYTALARKLAGAAGAYRILTRRGTWVYLTFNEIKISHP